MNRKKLITIAICMMIAGALMITGVAVARYKFTASSGKVISETLNRVNIEVSATEFTFRDVGTDGMLECRMNVSVSKTEPDFYGKLDSITLSGAQFGYVMFAASKDNGDALLPENVALPCGDTLEWELTFTVPYEEGKNTYEIDLDFNYTTGVKPDLTQQYLTTVPVTITVE